MREELLSFCEKDYWVYGPDESDFDFTFNLVKELIKNNQRNLQKEIKQAKLDYPEEDIWGEIQSDFAHYAWVNEQYLWQFCLWRIQGIFEALLINVFLPEPPTKKLIGLYSKINEAKKAGFELTEKQEEELFNWAKLRNALTHAPSEQYHPAPIGEDDIFEYIEFIKSICIKWRGSKNAL